MHEIDRGLLLVFPKRPFVDWLNSVDTSGRPVTLDELWREPDAILVKEFETDDDADKLVERLGHEIFEHVLLEWEPDRAAWPATRDKETFREWFDVRCLPVVFDQVDDRIRHLD